MRMLAFIVLGLSCLCVSAEMTVHVFSSDGDALKHEIDKGKVPRLTSEQIPEYVARLGDKRYFIYSTMAALVQAGAPTVPALRRAYDNADVEVRRRVIETLGYIGPSAVDAQQEILPAITDANDAVRHAATKALARLGKGVLPAVLKTVRAADTPARAPNYLLSRSDREVVALEVLGLMGAEAAEAVPELLTILAELGEMQDEDSNHNKRVYIKEALRLIGTAAPEIAPTLMAQREAPLFSLRYICAVTLLHMRQDTENAWPVVLSTLQNRKTKWFAWSDTLSLLEYSDKPLPELSEHLNDSDPWVRRTLIGSHLRAASHGRGREGIPALIERLADTDEGVQAAAVRALGEFGDAAAASAEPIRALMKANRDSNLRISCVRAFERLGKYAPGVEADIFALLKEGHLQPHKAQAGTPGQPMKMLAGSGRDDTDEVRKACVMTLYKLKPEGPRLLNSMLSDPDALTRRMGAGAIAFLGREAQFCLDALVRLSVDPDELVTAAALSAIAKIDPELHKRLNVPNAQPVEAKKDHSNAELPPKPPKDLMEDF